MLETSTVDSIPPISSLELIHRRAWGCQWPSRRIRITRGQVLGAGNEAESFQNEYSLFTPDTVDELTPEWHFDCLLDVAQVALACDMSEPISGDLVVLDYYPQLYERIQSGHRILITGHPGIGKTAFLLYVLLRRLEQRLPTAIQFTEAYFYLFTSEGVQKLSGTQRFLAPAGCWALSDSNQGNDQPCPAFSAGIDTASQQRIKIIHAISHWSSRKRGIEKHMQPHIYILPLPKVTEIIAIVSQVSTIEPHHVTRLVSSWGPCIRTILAIVGNSHGHQAGELWAHGRAFAAALAVCNNPGLFHPPLDPGGDPVSPLIFIAPAPVCTDCPPGVSWMGAPFMPTDSLCAIVAERVRASDNDKSLQIFTLLGTRGPNWASAGPSTFREKEMHGALLGHAQRGPLQIDGADGTVAYVRVADTLAAGTLPSLRRVTGTPSTYWIPYLPHLAGIDAVLIDDQCVYAFQATDTAQEYRNPSDGLVRLWAGVSPDVRASRRWLFVACETPYERATSLTVTDRLRVELATFTLGNGIPVEIWSAVIKY